MPLRPPIKALGAGLALLGLSLAWAPVARAHTGGGTEALLLPGSAARTPEEQRLAALQAALILSARPADHQRAIAQAWANPQTAFSTPDLHPSVVFGTALFALAYFVGIGPLRRRYALGPPATKTQVAWFVASCLLLLLALNGPLHHLSDYYLLSAHMLQHILLALIYAPMLLAGIPGWLLSPILRVPVVLRLGRLLTRPLVAYLLFTAILIGWHLPPAYELALRDHNWHIAQHLMFLVSAVILWWPIVGPAPELPRLSYLWQIGYLFLLQIPMFSLGALIALAEYPIYPFYSLAPRVVPGLGWLTDQQYAGLLMWLPGHLILWLPMGVLFFRWFASQRDDATGLDPVGRGAA
jgi:putative membrane protein